MDTHLAESESHSCRVPSTEPEAMEVPSEPTAQAHTASSLVACSVAIFESAV